MSGATDMPRDIFNLKRASGLILPPRDPNVERPQCLSLSTSIYHCFLSEPEHPRDASWPGPAVRTWGAVRSTGPIYLGSAARRRDRFRCGSPRHQTRRQRALLRPQGWQVRLELLSRGSTPTRGIYGESSWLASRKALGASDDFERFQQVLIGWHAPTDDVTLGARANYAWSSDGTPFFLRPFIQLRGVPAVRYQGDQAASVELEARWQVFGRWSVVAFGGAGETRTTRQTFAATRNVGSGGVGFRYLLASKFGMHAGIDVAHSPGTTAFYIVVGSAWFRP